MPVSAIDHVNIVTDDLDETCSFYSDLLGLTRAESPGTAMGFKGAWLCDSTGNAIVHLMLNDPGKTMMKGHTPGASTGPIHHVALRCSGFDDIRSRAAAMGLEPRVSDGILGLRQIFVSDPSNVTLELNFSGS